MNSEEWTSIVCTQLRRSAVKWTVMLSWQLHGARHYTWRQYKGSAPSLPARDLDGPNGTKRTRWVPLCVWCSTPRQRGSGSGHLRKQCTDVTPIELSDIFDIGKMCAVILHNGLIEVCRYLAPNLSEDIAGAFIACHIPLTLRHRSMIMVGDFDQNLKTCTNFRTKMREV